MKEYMLRILNKGSLQKAWPAESHLEFVKKCEAYIGRLNSSGKLIAAQPLAKQGVILSGRRDEWKKEPLDVLQEIQVGYYHIRAKDIDEAIKLAKENPEFEYSSTARIEIRPITEEEGTGFVYPR